MDGKSPRSPTAAAAKPGPPIAPPPPGRPGKKEDMNVEEERAVGHVSGAVYGALYRATGSKFSVPVMVFMFAMEYG